MRPLPLLAAALALAACTPTQTGPAGTWTGLTRPDGLTGPAANAEICDAPTSATLTARPDGTFLLTPNNGVLTLSGTAAKDGQLTATLTLHPSSHQTATLAFSGRIEGDTLQGTLTTPRCHATITLHRAPARGWFGP